MRISHILTLAGAMFEKVQPNLAGVFRVYPASSWLHVAIVKAKTHSVNLGSREPTATQFELRRHSGGKRGKTDTKKDESRLTRG